MTQQSCLFPFQCPFPEFIPNNSPMLTDWNRPTSPSFEANCRVWLEAASTTGNSSAFKVAVMLLWMRSRQLADRIIKFSARGRHKPFRPAFGLGPRALSAGIRMLSKAGLIDVSRKPGRMFEIELKGLLDEGAKQSVVDRVG